MDCRLYLVAYPSESEERVSEIVPKVTAAIFSKLEKRPTVFYVKKGDTEGYGEVKTMTARGLADEKHRARNGGTVVVMEDFEDAISFLGATAIRELSNAGVSSILIFFSTKTDAKLVSKFRESVPACDINYLKDMFPADKDGVRHPAPPAITHRVIQTPVSLTQAEECARRCAASGKSKCSCDKYEDVRAIVAAVYGEKPLSSGDVALDTPPKLTVGATDVKIGGATVPAEVAIGGKMGKVAETLEQQLRARLAAGDLGPEERAAATIEALDRIAGKKPDAALPDAIAEAAAEGMAPDDKHVIYTRDPRALAILSALLEKIGVQHVTVTSSTSVDLHTQIVENLFNGADSRYGAVPRTVQTAVMSAMMKETRAQEAQARHAMRAFKCAVLKDFQAGRVPTHTSDRDDQAIVEESTTLDLVAKEVGGASFKVAHQRARAVAAVREDDVKFTRDAPWVLLTDTIPLRRPKFVTQFHVLDGGEESLEVAKALYGRDDPYYNPRLQILSHVSIIPPASGESDYDDDAPYENADEALYVDECDGVASDDDAALCDDEANQLEELGIPRQAFEFTGYLSIKTRTDNRRTIKTTREVEQVDGSGRKEVETSVTTHVRPTESSEKTYVRKYDIMTCASSRARRARKATDLASASATATDRLMGSGLRPPKVVSCFDDTISFAPSNSTGAVRRVKRYSSLKVTAHDANRAIDALEEFDAFFASAHELIGESEHVTVKQLSERLAADFA